MSEMKTVFVLCFFMGALVGCGGGGRGVVVVSLLLPIRHRLPMPDRIKLLQAAQPSLRTAATAVMPIRIH